MGRGALLIHRDVTNRGPGLSERPGPDLENTIIPPPCCPAGRYSSAPSAIGCSSPHGHGGYSSAPAALGCRWAPAALGCRWAPAALGCSWAPAALGCSWAPAALGCSWAPAALGCSWAPAALGCSWAPLPLAVAGPLLPSAAQDGVPGQGGPHRICSCHSEGPLWSNIHSRCDLSGCSHHAAPRHLAVAGPPLPLAVAAVTSRAAPVMQRLGTWPVSSAAAPPSPVRVRGPGARPSIPASLWDWEGMPVWQPPPGRPTCMWLSPSPRKRHTCPRRSRRVLPP